MAGIPFCPIRNDTTINKVHVIQMITTIIPVYNTEKWLPRCLDSVLNQTYRDIEVIIVDDGSTDSSSKICEEYAKKDSRIRIIRQENQGALKARLNALSIAQGEWISFVDSDDWIEPDMYESLLNISGESSQILWGEVYLERKNGQREITNFDVRNDSAYITKQILLGKIDGWMCNKLIKRDLFFSKSVDMSDAHMMYEDMLWTIEMLSEGPNVTYLSKPFYHYNLTNELAATATSSDAVLCRAKHNISLIYEFFKKNEQFEKFKNEFSVLAMRYKISEAKMSSLNNARKVFPFAHKKLSNFPFKSKFTQSLYWLYFNTGMIGSALFTLKRTLK